MQLFCLLALPALLQGGGSDFIPDSTPDPVAALPFRKVRTPDGSLFLVLSRPGLPLAHWASFTRMGRRDDPPDLPGLAEACHLSTFFGTFDLGSRDPELEKKALEELDEALERLAAAGNPKERAEAFRAVRRKREAARSFARLDRFRQTLARLPASPPEIGTDLDGSYVRISVPAARVLDLATLMRARRREPVLREVSRLQERIRRRLSALESRDLSPGLRQAILTAIQRHPVRNLAFLPEPEAPPCTRRRALRFFREHQRPERSVTVIVGSFDADAVVRGLYRLFRSPPPGRGPDPAPREPPPAGAHIMRLKTPGPPTLVLAWRVPEGMAAADFDLCRMLLDPIRGFLAPENRIGGFRLTGLRFDPSPIGRRPPSLSILRILPETAEGLPDDFRDRCLERLDSLLDGEEGARVLETLRAEWTRGRRTLSERPAPLALAVAREAALGSWPPPPPSGDPEVMRRVARKLLDPAASTSVFSDPAGER